MTRALALALFATVAAAASPEDAALYQRWCARCHGERGDGKGPAAVALVLNGAAPRDFTGARFKLASVPSGAAPTDDDLVRTIARGIPGTSMPAFADLLSADEMRRLAAVVRGFATRTLPVGTPLDLGVEPPDDAAGRQRGAALYGDLGCAACHGAAGRGDGPSAAQLRASDGTPIVPADLARPWTFKGGGTARDVTMRLAAGIGGTPMPSYLESASVAQLWDVAHFVASLALAPSLHDAAVAAARAEPGAGEPPVRRGEYLATSGTCFLCHVQMQPDGAYVPGSFGAGGMRVRLTHLGVVVTRNLTPDKETGIGAWSAADLRRALHEGRSQNRRVLSPLDMPWTLLAGLRDADVDALHAYLQTLPAVPNLVSPPEAPSLVDGVARKLVALVRGDELAAVYLPGNAGHAPAPGEPTPTTVNPRAYSWLALTALLAVLLARRGARLVVGMLAVALLVVYSWPPLRWMPPALVHGEPPFAAVAAAMNLPPIRRPPAPVGTTDDDTRALAERGRYVATVGTCPLCHTAGPSLTRLWRPFPEMGGGMRVNWKVFGTVYSRNLTPDRETGLGAWSDAEIERAIRSGIARDGRTMHWQAMPWDHFSRLSPEDLHALVVYLRHLPPVHSAVPPPEPPRADDADGDSFGFGYHGTYRP